MTSRKVLDAPSANSGEESLRASAIRLRHISSRQRGGQTTQRMESENPKTDPACVESIGREEITAVQIDQFQRTTAATSDAGQRIVSDVHVQAGFIRDQPIQVT